MDIMVRVRLDEIGGAPRVVRLFTAQVDSRTGYPPVLHAGLGVLAMKLAVNEIPGVPECRRPDLLSSPLVPGQHGDLARGIADPVGTERCARRQLLVWFRWGDGRGVAPGNHAVRADRAGHRHTDRATTFDSMGLAEKDQESLLGDERFQTGPANRSTVFVFHDRGSVSTLR